MRGSIGAVVVVVAVSGAAAPARGEDPPLSIYLKVSALSHDLRGEDGPTVGRDGQLALEVRQRPQAPPTAAPQSIAIRSTSPGGMPASRRIP